MTKKNWIKIWILIVVICIMCFSDCSFAAEWDGLDVLWFSLNFVVSVLSWIWVFFANLAGTFLTNKWVYGEAFGLDALMWQYWNIMKNLANFGLWFYLVYVIFKWLIKEWKEWITQKIKDIILWLLIAWVWIQASWFFVAAIVDVSTITLAAVWAFPAQVISGSPYTTDALKKSLSDYLSPGADTTFVENGEEISLFPKESKNLLETKIVKLKTEKEFTGFVDLLLPSADNVSWPLYYIWFSILEANKINSINTSSDKWIKATILNTIIQWWTTIIFSIEMLVLCVLALMRIIYLWMFIIMSPLAVLLRCIEQSWQKLDGNDSFFSKFMKQINFKSFFINVFKPTIIVLWFWIAMLFVSLMASLLVDDSKGKTIDINWTIMSSNPDPAPTNSNQWDQTYTTSIDNNLIEFTLAHTWKTFLGIILSVLTVLIVYFIIKFAMKFWDWKDFVSEKIWKVQDAMWEALTTLPVVPVSWYDEKWQPTVHALSAGQVFGLWNKPSLIDSTINKYQSKVNEEYRKQEDIIKSWVWNNAGHLSATEEMEIKNRMTNKTWDSLKKTKEYIDSIKTNEWKWMTLDGSSGSSKLWIQEFTKWLEWMNGKTVSWTNDLVWNNMISRWNNDNNKDKTLEMMFKKNGSTETQSVKAYADFFGLWNITEWKDLKDADISKK